MTSIEFVSYTVNVILLTAEITGHILKRRHNRSDENNLEAIFDMAKRLARRLNRASAEQAKDVASAIKSLAMSMRGEQRKEITQTKKTIKKQK